MTADVIEFDIRTPVAGDIMRERVAWALPRYRSVDLDGAASDVLVNIVANGPSALDAPLDGFTVALNGAMKLFTDEGKAPDLWLACDPLEAVASFVVDAPMTTRYLVASKCHPRVFSALEDRDVRLWHIDDVDIVPWGVPSACTITLVALGLLRMMGYRKFRIWGWDGCYLDGKDHAVPQDHSGDRVTVYVDGQSFQTTTSWACEAQDAVRQLSTADYQIQVVGPGMIAPILRALCPQVLTDFTHAPGDKIAA